MVNFHRMVPTSPLWSWPQHTETSKVPHAPKVAEEYIMSPQSLLLCLRRIAISLPFPEGTSIAYWIGAFFD